MQDSNIKAKIKEPNKGCRLYTVSFSDDSKILTFHLFERLFYNNCQYSTLYHVKKDNEFSKIHEKWNFANIPMVEEYINHKFSKEILKDVQIMDDPLIYDRQMFIKAVKNKTNTLDEYLAEVQNNVLIPQKDKPNPYTIAEEKKKILTNIFSLSNHFEA